MKRTIKLVMASALAAGLVVVAGAGVASAKGKPTPTGASGTATCSVNASLSFTPALMSTATGNSAVSMNIQLVRCTAAGMRHRTTGHVASVSLGSIPSNTCTAPTAAPAFSNLSIRWTPTSQVAASLVSSAAGSMTTLASGDAQLSYSALTVTGSFATTTGSATLATHDTVAALEAMCTASGGSGLASISFGGSATL